MMCHASIALVVKIISLKATSLTGLMEGVNPNAM